MYKILPGKVTRNDHVKNLWCFHYLIQATTWNQSHHKSTRLICYLYPMFDNWTIFRHIAIYIYKYYMSIVEVFFSGGHIITDIINFSYLFQVEVEYRTAKQKPFSFCWKYLYLPQCSAGYKSIWVIITMTLTADLQIIVLSSINCTILVTMNGVVFK